MEPNRMILEDVAPFEGQHCEATATGSLLKRLGLHLSEPMIFGLGEGLGYIFWKMKTMDFPFIGGRVKPDQLTENLCRNLNLNLEIKETRSQKKAWENVAHKLKAGEMVGLKLDCYHLEYFGSPIHFAGHYVALYGYDAQSAYLIDTVQQGSKVKTSLESLAMARSEKGSMSSPNRSYTIRQSDPLTALELAIPRAIQENARVYLNPPIANFGYKGIVKTSKEILKWFANSEDIKRDFQTTAMLMEKAGTGGSLFRNLYRDFLQESYQLLGIPAYQEAYQSFVEIAQWWKEVAELFHQAGETEEIAYLHQAAERLREIARQEQNTLERLASS